MKYALHIAFLVALSGCATSVTPTGETAPVPLEHVLAPGLTKRVPGKTAVSVKRDTGITGPWCRVRLYVNGAQAAELARGEIVTFYLEPGDHILSAKPACPMVPMSAELGIIVRDGKPRSYRVGADNQASMILTATAF